MAPIVHLAPSHANRHILHTNPNQAVCGIGITNPEGSSPIPLTCLITDNYLDYSSTHWGRKGPPTCPSCLLLYTDDPSVALVLTF